MRLDVYFHGSEDPRLDQILSKLNQVLIKEEKIMALGQVILDAVTAETTKVGSFIALVQGLISDNTIPADVGAAILAKAKEGGDALDAAIAANTPPTP